MVLSAFFIRTFFAVWLGIDATILYLLILWYCVKKLVLVILDGLGDRPNRLIGNKTALERAKTPNMDKLAKGGRCGLMYTVGKGISPESDAAMYAIMGYDPFTNYTGRAAFEALGLGIKIRNDEVAMRGNLATVDEMGRIVDARAGRIGGSDATALIDAIDGVELSAPVKMLVRKQEGYRFVVVFRSDELELHSNISNTHPGYIKPGTKFGVAHEFKLGKTEVPRCMAFDKESETMAKAVNEFTDSSHEVLKKHPVNVKREVPANCILLRDASKGLPKIRGLKEKFGLLWGAVTERTVEKGICSHVGMDIVKVGKEKDLVKDCKNKVGATLRDIDFYDCVYVYIKGPDSPSHDGDVMEKVGVIEKIDEHLIDGLTKGLDMDNTVICVTADHSTPCETRSHSDDPVPLLIHGAGKDSCRVFSEPACAKGSIGTIEGQQLMGLLAKTLNFKRRRD